MTRRICGTLLALALVAVAMPPAGAQPEPEELPDELLAALDTTPEAIADLEPNPAWSDLGLFSDDALRVIGAATEPATGGSYAFGDSKDVPPIIEPSGTRPTGVGSLLFELPDTWAPPAAGWTDAGAFAQTNRPLQAGDTFVLFWAEMDGDYDFTSGLTVNEGFPITVPGLPVWNSTFAGDTWEGANVIPNAVYDGTTLTYDVKQYQPPQQFPLVDLAGFYYRSGNIMAMAVDATELAGLSPDATPAAAANDGVDRTLLYQGDSATRPAQFDPLAIIDTMIVRAFVHAAIELFAPGFIWLTGDYEVAVTLAVLFATFQLLITPVIPTPAPDPEPEPTPDPDPTPADPAPGVVDQPADPGTGDPPSDRPADGASDDGSDLLWWLFIGAGLVILMIALLLLLGPKRGARDDESEDEDEEDEEQDDDEDEEQEDLSSTPPTIPASTPEEEPTGLRPVIFVPGIMASSIKVNGNNGPETVWPPVGFGFDARKSLEALQATPSDRMGVSTGPTSTGLLPGIHLKLLDFLQSYGYQLAPTDGTPANCYVHSYNWLRPCAEAGASLVALINRATAEHGKPPHIIAHSMGGLVTRSALIQGKAVVDKVIYCGSPHLGAPMAYYSIHPDIPYAFMPGALGTLLNAVYATATSGADSDISFTDDDSWAITKALEFGVKAVEKTIEGAAHAMFSGDMFDEQMKRVSQNATGVFELLPDELYFTHVNPTFPVVTHKDRWFNRGGVYKKYDYVPSSALEAYRQDGNKDIPALPPHLIGKVTEALAFKQAISGPLPPGGPERTIVVYGASHDTKSEAVMTDDGDADTRGEIEATLGGDQGGDGTVPKESGRAVGLHGAGVTLERDNSTEHFMMTETARFHSIVQEHLEPGGR